MRQTRTTDNPYSKLAVEIMRTIRSSQLTLSSSIVPYLKMLVTLGALRHELATGYDLAAQVRRFFRLLVRQQAIRLLDPAARRGTGLCRCRAGAQGDGLRGVPRGSAAEYRRCHRSFLGFRTRARDPGAGWSASACRRSLSAPCCTSSSPTRRTHRRCCPTGSHTQGIHYGLLVLLVVIVVVLIAHVRGMSRPE